MKKWKWLLSLSVFSWAFLNVFSCFSMDTACVHQLLVYLKNNQSEGKTGFPDGLFPAYRQYVYRPGILKKDPNFFFTGLVLYTLNEIYPKLPEADQTIMRSIREKALPALSLFKNKNGDFTYNFWRTQPPEIFPHSGWMNWFNRQQSLPDDFDDTSIGLLALKTASDTAEMVHQYMQHFTNCSSKRIKNTFKKYRKIPAYSVWFGKNFPVDFDVCVLSNTLSFVSTYHLPWTKADSASLKVIEMAIKSHDYIYHPGYISPHYQLTAIILYHLSRLTAVAPTLLLPYRKDLIAEAEKEFRKSQNPVEKIMLATTLKRWGIDVFKLNYHFDLNGTACSVEIQQTAQSDFVFFIANMASMLPNPLKAIGSFSKIGQFNYYCPAFNVALLLEYKMTSLSSN